MANLACDHLSIQEARLYTFKKFSPTYLTQYAKGTNLVSEIISNENPGPQKSTISTFKKGRCLLPGQPGPSILMTNIVSAVKNYAAAKHCALTSRTVGVVHSQNWIL